MIEAFSGKTLGAYFNDHVTGPMGMADTAFTPTVAMAERMSLAMVRQEDGSLMPAPLLSDPNGPPPEFEMGGGGLLSTTRHYGKFLRIMLNRGTSMVNGFCQKRRLSSWLKITSEICVSRHSYRQR